MCNLCYSIRSIHISCYTGSLLLDTYYLHLFVNKFNPTVSYFSYSTNFSWILSCCSDYLHWVKVFLQRRSSALYYRATPGSLYVSLRIGILARDPQRIDSILQYRWCKVMKCVLSIISWRVIQSKNSSFMPRLATRSLKNGSCATRIGMVIRQLPHCFEDGEYNLFLTTRIIQLNKFHFHVNRFPMSTTWITMPMHLEFATSRIKWIYGRAINVSLQLHERITLTDTEWVIFYYTNPLSHSGRLISSHNLFIK